MTATKAFLQNIQLGQGAHRNHISVFRFVLILALIYNVLPAILTMLKMMGFYYVGHLDKIVLPFVGFLIFSALILKGKTRPLPDIAILLLLMIPLGTMVGLYKGFESRYLISHIFTSIFVFILFTSYYNANWSIPDIDDLFKKISDWVLWIHAICLGIYWFTYFQGHSRYVGFSTISVLLPVSYYLANRNRLKLLFAIILIAISGKRGIYLALWFVMGFHVFRYYVKNILVVLVLCILSLVVVILTVFSILPLFSTIDVPVLSSIIRKFQLLNFLSPDFDFNQAISGRASEFIMGWREFRSSILNVFTGLGYGASYAWESSPGVWDARRHYFHFSPLNFFFQNGLILGSLFWLAICLWLQRFYSYIQHKASHPTEYMLFLYLIGLLIGALSSYVISREILFWAVFGLMAGTLSKKRTVSDKKYCNTR